MANTPLYNYTLMPTHMRRMFSLQELRGAKLVAPLPFTKGVPVLKIPAIQPKNRDLVPLDLTTRLYDLLEDPTQEHPIKAPEIEARMLEHLVRLMKENHAPAEQFVRLGIRSL